MLLISGALVNGPYALITTAVSADLVSLASPVTFDLQREPVDFWRVTREGTALSQSKGIRSWKGSAELVHWGCFSVNECHACERLLNYSWPLTKQTKSCGWQPRVNLKVACKARPLCRCLAPFILCIFKWSEELYLCEMSRWFNSHQCKSCTWHRPLQK